MKMENKNFNEELDMLNNSFSIELIGCQLTRLSKDLSAKQQIYFLKMVQLRIKKIITLRLEVIEMCATV